MSDEQQRAAFEDWATSPPREFSVMRYENDKIALPGEYKTYSTFVAWLAWQAAIEHAKKETTE